MTEKYAPPQVIIRRYPASDNCDIFVLVRGQETVLRCTTYSQALQWARLECKSYKIAEPEIEQLLDAAEDEDVLPLFLRSQK